MWEEDIMKRTVWDIPNSHGCNRWSDDGMLSILTANSIQVFTPTFQHNSFYSTRWIQLELLGENEGLPKKSKTTSAIPKEAFTASTGEDLIHWMTTVNSTEDRSFGKQDINGMFFKKAAWGPPGLGTFSCSFLTTLLSDGTVFILTMGQSSHTNHQISSNDRRFNAHMFSLGISLNLSILFQQWKNKEHSSKTNTTANNQTQMEIDSDSEDENGNEIIHNNIPEHFDKDSFITEIASYPYLLSYNSSENVRTYSENERSYYSLLATGSSTGHINLWAITVIGSCYDAVCVCSTLLIPSTLTTNQNGNGNENGNDNDNCNFNGNGSDNVDDLNYNSETNFKTKKDVRRNFAITCLEFFREENDCKNLFHENNENISIRLLCGTSEGFLIILNINSVTNNFDNRQNGENGGNIENGKNGKYGFSDNIPHLQIGKNVKIIRLFDTPIDTITISNNHSNSGGMYVRSGIKIVYLNNNFDKISPVENIHSHVVTSITLLEKRPYNEIIRISGFHDVSNDVSGDVSVLMTSSLDGEIKLWGEPVSHINGNSIEVDNNHVVTNNINRTNSLIAENNSVNNNLIQIDNKIKTKLALNHNLNYLQNIDTNKSSGVVSYVDTTCDPLQLVFLSTHLVPGSIVDSREVQMNKNLERTHCTVNFFLSPILPSNWISNEKNICDVFQSIIFPQSLLYLFYGDFSNVEMIDRIHGKNTKIMEKNSEIVIDGNSNDADRNEEENEIFNFNIKSYCGLSFSFLKSLDEVVQNYSKINLNTAEGSMTINQKNDLGIIDTNKRYKEKGTEKNTEKGTGKDKNKNDNNDDNDENDNDNDDNTVTRTGISDLAHKIKNLLYPNIENLIFNSLDSAILATEIISKKLNSLVDITLNDKNNVNNKNDGDNSAFIILESDPGSGPGSAIFAIPLYGKKNVN